MGFGKNQCHYCYFGLTLTIILIAIGSFGYFQNNFHPELISQPRDSNGIVIFSLNQQICSDIGRSGKYQSDKKYPFLYLDISNQNVEKYCVSMCPTGDSQFDQQNIQVYNSLERKNHQNFVKLRKNHKKDQQLSENKIVRNNGKIENSHFLNHHIDWPQIPQKPSQILGGICLSDIKLDILKNKYPAVYTNIKKKQLEIKLLWISALIIFASIICSVIYELITKTNINCCKKQKCLSIFEHNQILGPIDKEENIQNQSWTFDRINFLFVFILAIILILTTLISLVHQMIQISTTSNDSIFSQILQQFQIILKNKDSQNTQILSEKQSNNYNTLNLRIFLVLLLILFALTLFYLIYNTICRYNQVILKSLQFISKGKRNISKQRFLLYSIIGTFICIFLLTTFIYIIPKAITTFQQTIIYKDNLQIYGRINYQDPRVIVIVAFYGILAFYLLIFLDQFYLYLVTYDSVKKLRKQSIQFQQQLPYIFTWDDLTYISKRALLKFFFFLPIKLFQIFNITFSPTKTQNNSCLNILKSLSNQIHQFGLNHYIFYCMSQKVNLLKIVNLSKQNSKTDKFQVSSSIAHSLYSQSYTQQTQGPSFQTYKISQRIIIFFVVFLLLIYVQKLFPCVKQDESLNPIYSLPLIISFIAVIVTQFPLKFIFANAQTIELSRILLSKIKDSKVNAKY